MTYTTLEGNAILDFFTTTVIKRDTTLPGQSEVIDANAYTRQVTTDTLASNKAANEKRQKDFIEMMKSGGFLVAGGTVLIIMLSMVKRKKS